MVNQRHIFFTQNTRKFEKKKRVITQWRKQKTMEELRVRTRNEELKVKGSLELIQREREAFYQHIKETEEATAKAEAELVQNMCSMIRHNNMRYDKGTSNADKVGVLRVCGELQNTWEEIAAAIKCGTEFKVGDYKHSSMEDGQSFTMVITDVTNEYVRFESRDCIVKKWYGIKMEQPNTAMHVPTSISI